MDELVKAHAFNLGYEVLATVNSDTQKQTQLLGVIRIRLEILAIPVELLQGVFDKRNGRLINLQSFLHKVMEQLQVKHGDEIARYFIFPVNLFVLLENPPI